MHHHYVLYSNSQLLLESQYKFRNGRRCRAKIRAERLIQEEVVRARKMRPMDQKMELAIAYQLRQDIAKAYFGKKKLTYNCLFWR